MVDELGVLFEAPTIRYPPDVTTFFEFSSTNCKKQPTNNVISNLYIYNFIRTQNKNQQAAGVVVVVEITTCFVIAHRELNFIYIMYLIVINFILCYLLANKNFNYLFLIIIIT